MKKRIILILTIILLISNVTSVNSKSLDSINENTSAIIGGELENEEIGYRYNINENVTIASITKVMTYLVVKDEIEKGNGSLKDEIIVDKEVALTGGSSFKLKEGEIIKVEELLEAIMIVSGNDACLALAKKFAGTEANFVELMNKKAEEIGLHSAIFYTTNGLPDIVGKENNMNAKDVFKMAAYTVKKYPELIEITKKKKLEDFERDFKEPNTNNLLKSIPEVDGLKTGFTDSAGQCLIGTALKKDGTRVLSVVMGTKSIKSRDKKSKKLMKKLIDDFSMKTIQKREEVLEEVNLFNSEKKKVDVYTSENIEMFTDCSKDKVKVEIKAKDNLELPLKKGTVVGTAKFKAGSIEKTTDILVKEKITKFKLFRISIFRSIFKK